MKIIREVFSSKLVSPGPYQQSMFVLVVVNNKYIIADILLPFKTIQFFASQLAINNV